MTNFTWLQICAVLVITAGLPGCAGDRYQKQADTIKTHVGSFYRHLQVGQVDQAVSQNEQIESIAIRAEEQLLRRVGQMSQGEKTQQWGIIKTAKETAAENWLALARYFTEAKEYEKARGTYQRVIAAYQGSPFTPYANRARMGLHNLETILAPRSRPPSVHQSD